MCNIVQRKGVKKNGLAFDFVDLFGLLIFLSSFSACFLELMDMAPIFLVVFVFCIVVGIPCCILKRLTGC